MEEKSIQIRHYQDFGPGGLTLAICTCAGTCCLGFAFCSPEDEFCEYRGGEIARLRLHLMPVKVLLVGDGLLDDAVADYAVRCVLKHEWARLNRYGIIVPPELRAVVPRWTPDWHEDYQREITKR